MSVKSMNLAVIGLGKLGLPTAACFAKAGHTVVGYDTSAGLVEALRAEREALQSGEPVAGQPRWEPDLDEYLASPAVLANLSYTCDIAEAVQAADVILLIVPTPSGADDRFENQYVVVALEAMVPTLRKRLVSDNAKRFVIDVVSTVMPTSCDLVFRPLLEEAFQRPCGGTGWGLVYNPEFIALGSVIYNFTHPDIVLIGESDAESGDVVERMYRAMLDMPVDAAYRGYKRMSLLNAEIAKLSLNCALSAKIAVANTIGLTCAQFAGANADVVSDAVGGDSRIGHKLLAAGTGPSGPCLPRDVRALRTILEKTAPAFTSSPEVSQAVRDWICEQLPSAKGAKVVVLGLTYKPGVPVLDDSQTVSLLLEVTGGTWPVHRDAGYNILVHDHAPLDLTFFDYTADVYQLLEGAEAIVLMTHDPYYWRLDWARIDASVTDGCKIVDVWRLLKTHRRTDVFKRARWVPFGVGV